MSMENHSWRNHSGNIIDSVQDFDVIECKICNFKHIIPIPTSKELDLFYKKKFYGKIKPDYIKEHEKDLEWWDLVHKERYQKFEKYLKTKSRKILEIGCGPGFFLKLGKELGWEVRGIEPSVQASEYGKNMGLSIITGELNSQNLKGLGKFDVIYLEGVMEHLPDPAKAVKMCYKILKPGGLFCTIVANDYNPLQNILRETMDFAPWWILPSEHINYFEKKSLKKLMKKSGFEEIHSTVTFPMEIFLLMGENYVKNKKVGEKCHSWRKKMEFSFENSSSSEIKRKIYDSLYKLNLGRQLDVIYIKK